MKMDSLANRFLKLSWDKERYYKQDEYLCLIEEIEKKKIDSSTPHEAYMVGTLYASLFAMNIDNYDYAERAIEYFRIYFKSGCYDTAAVTSFIDLLKLAYHTDELYKFLKTIEAMPYYTQLAVKGLADTALLADGAISLEEYKKYSKIYLETLEKEYTFEKELHSM